MKYNIHDIVKIIELDKEGVIVDIVDSFITVRIEEDGEFYDEDCTSDQIIMIKESNSKDEKLVEDAKKLLNDLSKFCNKASSNAGWWNDPETGEDLLSNTSYAPFVVATKLLLIITEICEGVEGHRKNLMDDKIPTRKMLEVEIADALIRIFDISGKLNLDISGKLNLDIGGAVSEKLEFNVTRPDHKIEARLRPVGGKAY